MDCRTETLRKSKKENIKQQRPLNNDNHESCLTLNNCCSYLKYKVLQKLNENGDTKIVVWLNIFNIFLELRRFFAELSAII